MEFYRECPKSVANMTIPYPNSFYKLIYKNDNTSDMISQVKRDLERQMGWSSHSGVVGPKLKEAFVQKAQKNPNYTSYTQGDLDRHSYFIHYKVNEGVLAVHRTNIDIDKYKNLEINFVYLDANENLNSVAVIAEPFYDYNTSTMQYKYLLQVTQQIDEFDPKIHIMGNISAPFLGLKQFASDSEEHAASREKMIAAINNQEVSNKVFAFIDGLNNPDIEDKYSMIKGNITYLGDSNTETSTKKITQTTEARKYIEKDYMKKYIEPLAISPKRWIALVLQNEYGRDKKKLKKLEKFIEKPPGNIEELEAMQLDENTKNILNKLYIDSQHDLSDAIGEERQAYLDINKNLINFKDTHRMQNLWEVKSAVNSIMNLELADLQQKFGEQGLEYVNAQRDKIADIMQSTTPENYQESLQKIDEIKKDIDEKNQYYDLVTQCHNLNNNKNNDATTIINWLINNSMSIKYKNNILSELKVLLDNTFGEQGLEYVNAQIGNIANIMQSTTPENHEEILQEIEEIKLYTHMHIDIKEQFPDYIPNVALENYLYSKNISETMQSIANFRKKFPQESGYEKIQVINNIIKAFTPENSTESLQKIDEIKKDIDAQNQYYDLVKECGRLSANQNNDATTIINWLIKNSMPIKDKNNILSKLKVLLDNTVDIELKQNSAKDLLDIHKNLPPVESISKAKKAIFALSSSVFVGSVVGATLLFLASAGPIAAPVVVTLIAVAALACMAKMINSMILKHREIKASKDFRNALSNIAQNVSQTGSSATADNDTASSASSPPPPQSHSSQTSEPSVTVSSEEDADEDSSKLTP